MTDDGDFLVFDAGRKHVETYGIPVVNFFLLSSRPCSGPDALSAHSTLARGVGEIDGSGYARAISVIRGEVAFGPQTWSTGLALDWPASVKSVVLATTDDDSGTAIAAWNLRRDGEGRDMSLPSTTETFVPTLTLFKPR
jgi:hypothetical protein